MDGWKRVLVNLFGIGTTAATLIVIYFVLFMVGVINTIDRSVITEFLIVLVLTTSVKTFWYTSVESTYYGSEDYTSRMRSLSEDMDKNITNANDFDAFIRYENINNMNKYILNKCEGLTIDNYRYRWYDRIELFLRLIIFRKLPKAHYVYRYIAKVTKKATHVHKLSSANILSFSVTRYGLTDDRNPAKQAKIRYIISGIVFSTVATFVTALLSFTPNPDADNRAAMIKFITYTIQILYAILQTILSASNTVKNGTNAYCNRITTILDKYIAYKAAPVIPVVIDYMEELKNAGTVDNTATSCERYDDDTDGEPEQDAVRYDEPCVVNNS